MQVTCYRLWPSVPQIKLDIEISFLLVSGFIYHFHDLLQPWEHPPARPTRADQGPHIGQFYQFKIAPKRSDAEQGRLLLYNLWVWAPFMMA